MPCVTNSIEFWDRLVGFAAVDFRIGPAVGTVILECFDQPEKEPPLFFTGVTADRAVLAEPGQAPVHFGYFCIGHDSIREKLCGSN